MNVKLKFIDSLRFMNCSLDKLVKNMTKLKIVEKGFPNLNPGELQLLCRKGVYPYEYMDSREKMNETQLPVRERFFSELTGDHKSDVDYEHAQKV